MQSVCVHTYRVARGAIFFVVVSWILYVRTINKDNTTTTRYCISFNIICNRPIRYTYIMCYNKYRKLDTISTVRDTHIIRNYVARYRQNNNIYVLII